MKKINLSFNKKKKILINLQLNTLKFNLRHMFFPIVFWDKILQNSSYYNDSFFYNNHWILRLNKNYRICLNLKIVKKNYFNSYQFKEEFSLIFGHIKCLLQSY